MNGLKEDAIHQFELETLGGQNAAFSLDIAPERCTKKKVSKPGAVDHYLV